MSLTTWILVATVAVLIVYDIYAGLRFGLNGTLSAVMWRAATKFPVIPFAFGVLIGHLYWPLLFS